MPHASGDCRLNRGPVIAGSSLAPGGRDQEHGAHARERATHLRARVVAGNGADVGTWDCFQPLRIADDQALSQSARGQPAGDPSAHFTGGSGDRNQPIGSVVHLILLLESG